MSRPVRVLSVGHSYAVGVNRAIVREVARDPAFEVTVAAPIHYEGDFGPVALAPEPPASPLNLVGLHAYTTRFVHIFRYDDAALRDCVRAGRYDVVHAWEEPYVYAGYQIARAVRDTSARFCFRTAQSLRKWYPPPFGYFERSAREAASGWIAGGGLVYETMLARGYRAEEGRVITLAVDTEQFQPQPAAVRERVARELGFTTPIIGFVGRLTRAKGVSVLLDAIDRLGPNVPWSLLVLGSGPLEPTIHRWAAARGVTERVRVMVAPHADVARYLAAVDVLVAPSQTTSAWREQFGRMVIEAFAAGAAVIGSDSGEIPYVIGDAGRIVREDDAAGYARNMEELLTDASVRADLIARGLERVQRYSVRAVAAQYREYYRELAERA